MQKESIFTDLSIVKLSQLCMNAKSKTPKLQDYAAGFYSQGEYQHAVLRKSELQLLKQRAILSAHKSF